jgi:hypothetical protein
MRITCPNCLAGGRENDPGRGNRMRWFICASCEHVWCEIVAPSRKGDDLPASRLASASGDESSVRARDDAEERLVRVDRMFEHLQKQRSELREVVGQSRNRHDKDGDRVPVSTQTPTGH